MPDTIRSTGKWSVGGSHFISVLTLKIDHREHTEVTGYAIFLSPPRSKSALTGVIPTRRDLRTTALSLRKGIVHATLYSGGLLLPGATPHP